MRIGICDDEKEIQELIEEKVRKHCPEEEIVIFSSGEELLAAEPTPDLVFLDIRMDGKNGVQMLDDASALTPPTIPYTSSVRCSLEMSLSLSI